MNFNISNLDFQDETIEDTGHRNKAPHVNSSNKPNASAILTDLQCEVESLQNKIKLHQKQVYFLEAENSKINQEKNTLFFQNKTYEEKLSILTERNDGLSTAYDEVQMELELVSEKEKASQNLIQTQSLDLQRLTRFHLKIKNTIKPYILGLKNKTLELQAANDQLTKSNIDLHHINIELSRKLADTTSDLEKMKHSFSLDRNNLIKTYEDQLHDLAREIVDIREIEDRVNKENQTLKKKLEFKHALENENIRLKRESTDQMKKVSDLEFKLHQVNEWYQSALLQQSTIQEKYTHAESQLAQKDMALESTRKQLFSKIEELEKIFLRIKMFEKLNTQLSLSQSEIESAQFR